MTAVSLIPRLVRGLDYYSHTAFEFVTERLGAQGTVMAGGRYDGLVEEMGGPPTPSVGWAAGVERLSTFADAIAPDPAKVPGIASREADPLPAPRPYREIFVWSPDVEGVHLRFGPVARGGLRWSDRRDDFRARAMEQGRAEKQRIALRQWQLDIAFLEICAEIIAPPRGIACAVRLTKR